MHPSFNPRKESLRPGTIAIHGVERLREGLFREPRLQTAAGINSSFQAKHQIFCARQHKNIAVIAFGKALLRFSLDVWNRELPAQADGKAQNVWHHVRFVAHF
jgi:hypothetical protein